MFASGRITIFAAAILVAPSVHAADGPDRDGNIEVTRVTLATGGLAEVEGALVAPGDTMRLAIERALVADVLRTLVITGDAPVRAIDLEAAEPVGERSATGRLISGDLSDPTTILQSLVGENVEVRGGATQIEGRLLAYSLITIPGSETQGERPAVRIAVATEDGRVAYATFETNNALAIEGPAVGERMAGVVPALRQSVDDGRRELTVRLDGEADAGFSFVVPTTVWRPSYRAIVGEGGAVDLQGWATLENTTGLDWNDIELRLAVGTPVAYYQDVYSPLRTSRPWAPFEVGRTAEVPLVEQDVGGVARDEAEAYNRQRFASAMQSLAVPAEAAPPPAPRETAKLITGGDALTGSAASIFPVDGTIDLAAGRTLTVPFLANAGDAERIAFVDLGMGERPMDALEIAFDESATVPGGLIAVYDADGFVGDARFAGADGGEVTILPFALSTDVNVRITGDNRQSISSASIVDGALRVRRQAQRDIMLVAEAAEATTLVVDVPRASGEEITGQGGAGVEVSTVNPQLARVRVELEPGETRIALTGVRPIFETYMVSNIPTPVIEEVLSVNGAVDEETAARLRAVADAAAEIAAIDRRLATLEADLSDLREAVAADRENLEAIDVTTPEGARIRERLIARTDEIDTTLESVRSLRQDRLEAERKLRNP